MQQVERERQSVLEMLPGWPAAGENAVSFHMMLQFSMRPGMCSGNHSLCFFHPPKHSCCGNCYPEVSEEASIFCNLKKSTFVKKSKLFRANHERASPEV